MYDVMLKNFSDKLLDNYRWRFNGICEHIEALENLQNDITGEWNAAYEEDLKESE